MALVNRNIKVSLPDSILPSGYTKPAYTEIVGAESVRTISLSVAKATVQNADKAVTLANILSNVTVGVDKQITDIVTADYVATNTVEYLTEVLDINSNVQKGVDTDFYSDTAFSYVVKVKLYVKTT